MTGWVRTGDGWALNVDGSDAAKRFSLPRLELHSSAQGWECLCLLADGRSHRTRGPRGSTSSAKRTTVEEARNVLGAEYAGVLDELLAYP